MIVCRSRAACGRRRAVALPEDVLLDLLLRLAAVDGRLEGAAWTCRCAASARDVRALAATCLSALATLTGPGDALLQELDARRTTDVRPRDMHAPFPFVEQAKREAHGRDLLATMDRADRECAFHCASRCCEAARRSADNRRRRASKGAPARPSIVAASTSARLTAVCADEDACCFVYTHKPTPSVATVTIRADGTPKTTTHDLSIDGPPLAMSASPGGEALAVVTHSTDPDDASLPDLLARKSLLVCTFEGKGGACRAQRRFAFDDCHPQQTWWARPATRTGSYPDSSLSFYVAWSTQAVLPCSMRASLDELRVADVTEARYWLARYDCWYGYDNHGPVRVDSVPDDLSGPHCGGLVSASTSERGDRVVALCYYPTSATIRGPSTVELMAVVHYRGTTLRLFHPDPEEHRSKKKKKKKKSNTGDGFPALVAAGMSPTGDCILCVHRSDDAVVAEIFELEDDVRYRSVRTCDLTEWMACDSGFVFGTDRVFEFGYAVEFSRCGRYVAIVDQRARWRTPITGYAGVVVDVGRRRTHARVPRTPLCYCECDDDAPNVGGAAASSSRLTCTPLRSIEWGDRVAWIMAHRGLLAVVSNDAPRD